MNRVLDYIPFIFVVIGLFFSFFLFMPITGAFFVGIGAIVAMFLSDLKS